MYSYPQKKTLILDGYNSYNRPFNACTFLSHYFQVRPQKYLQASTQFSKLG